ncbi:MAG: EAL domain-containing protein, partial [Azonexus sp.]|nr:EAL domain-containing protein [Azonexus sp.]
LPLGNWVLLAACRQAKAWLDAGLDLGEIAVNISALQFCQPDFAMTVQRILLETGLPPERLELEITESTVMQSADSSVKVLAELKKMGIKLAIDDFGTGYSSLTYLRRFSVDRLKIDRSFVADLESDVDAASLVASIVSMGHTLGLELVAEGVENAVQADFLRDRHCQRVQGFHFSRPVSAEAVVGLSHIFRRSSQLV